MKSYKYLFTIYFFFSAFLLNAQSINPNKPSLDIKDLSSWVHLNNEAELSNDGKYVYYTVEDEIPNKKVIYVANIAKTWLKKIVGASQLRFSNDSKLLIGIDENDHLFLIRLGTEIFEKKSEIDRFEIFSDGLNEKIAYLVKGRHELRIRDTNSNYEVKYDEVNDYLLAPDKKSIVIKGMINKAGENESTLSLVDPNRQRKITVWRGGEVSNLKFDKQSRQIVFGYNDSTGLKGIWIYNIKTNRIRSALDKSELTPYESFQSNDVRTFDDNHLIINMVKNQPISPKTGVDVYSYTDTIPMSTQLESDNNNNESFVASIDLNKKGLLRLTFDNESLSYNASNSEVGIIRKDIISRCEVKSSFYLVSTLTGERKSIPMEPISKISPDGKFIILKSDPRKGSSELYVYEISTGHVRNLTKNITVFSWEERVFKSEDKFNFLAFFDKSNQILVGDNYDLWKLDLNGKIPPLKLTNGFKNKISFLPATLNYTSLGSQVISCESTQNLLLESFNHLNKDNDFYMLDLSSKKAPIRLTNGGALYGGSFIRTTYQRIFDVRKAKFGNLYLFSKKTAKNSTNWYISSDFKNISQISNIEPERKFNWLSSELITFNALDNHRVEGVLYKPENFDSAKKYPIIFECYIYRSSELNDYLVPELSMATINIPYYVSNGYLVFCPDIPFSKSGYGLQTAFDCIVGAAKYFSSQSYIDSNKIALNGHSYGGGEVNYVVTHTNKFAAAVVAAGIADFIGGHGQAIGGKGRGWVQLHQGAYIPGDIFTNTNDYLKFSPKNSADKLTTPLLLMHNKPDPAVPFSEGLSFFNSLWDLGKRSWLLQYDNDSHMLFEKKNQLDFTIRMKQFFDHYLKDNPAPVWMTRGINVTKKGIENGYEYDQQIATPLILTPRRYETLFVGSQ